MIGLDTNILLRLVDREDAVQTRRVRDFLANNCTEENPGFVNRAVLCEVAWVLTQRYKLGRAAVADFFSELADMSDIVLEDTDLIRRVLLRYVQTNIGFADLLIAETNLAAGCKATATFDKRAAKLAGFTAVP